MWICKRFIFRFVFIIAWFPILSGTFGFSQVAAQPNGGKTLTVYLRELNAKYGERISFSPTITDKIRPHRPPVAGVLEESLTKLLHGTNLSFRDMNGHYYIYIRVKEAPPVLSEVLPKKKTKKEPEEKQKPLPPLASTPWPVVFPIAEATPEPRLPYPVIQPTIFPELPRFAVKTNLLYDATATINLGFEFAIAEKWTIDLSGNYNAWDFSKSRKWKHVLLQPELRYWTYERFNGHFFGAHLHAGMFNIGALPSMGKIISENMRQHRYEGEFYGGGISYGYHWMLDNRWSLESSIGLGYARIRYDKYRCEHCGEKTGAGTKNYLGPTKSSISLIFKLK